jgi:hypothetical protein
MGQAFNMLAQGMKEALDTFKKFGPHKGLPTLGDVPVIIRAMTVRKDAAVAEEAHAALVWLAGRDLGRDPAAWKQWWACEGQEILSREAAVDEVRELFLGVKRAVLVGDWKAIHASLSAGLRGKYSPGDLSRRTICTSPALRGVYRDTTVRKVELDGGTGRIDVDWGRLGFQAESVPVRREDGEWRLACLPWSDKLVKREAPVTNVRPADRPESRFPEPRAGRPAAPRRARRRRSRLFGRGLLSDVLIVLLFLLPLGLCYFWPVVLIVHFAALFPAVLFWVLIFGRMKTPREIRQGLQRMRGGR